MRQVSLLIGRQSYSMKTALSDDEIKDAQEIVNEIMHETGMVSEQEIRLALACMVLANRLAVASRRLDRIVSPDGNAHEEETDNNEPVISSHSEDKQEKETGDNELGIGSRSEGEQEEETDDIEPVIDSHNEDTQEEETDDIGDNESVISGDDP